MRSFLARVAENTLPRCGDPDGKDTIQVNGTWRLLADYLAEEAMAGIKDTVAKTRVPKRPHRTKLRAKGRDMIDVAHDATEALREAGAPLFIHDGKPARVVEAGGRATITPLDRRSLHYVLSTYCTTDSKPFGVFGFPERATDLVLEMPHSFPLLDRVIVVPMLLEDGRLVWTRGYHADARVYYAPPPELVVPSIPKRPTIEEASAAGERLGWLLRDFPFLDDPSCSNASRRTRWRSS